MRTPGQRLRWPLALVAVTLLGFGWLTRHEQWWDYLGVYHIRPYFADLVAILASGEAWHAGRDVYATPNPFDPFGRPHVYGPWWLVSGPLGLKVADARWLGWLLATAFFATAAALFAPRRPATVIAALLLLLAPSVLLGVERANNDLIIFLLLALAGALLARPDAGARHTGAGLVGLAAVLKIYPLAALPALVAGRIWPRHVALRLLGVVLAACLLVFCWWLGDYTRVSKIAPQPETLFAYGLPVPVFFWTHLPQLRGQLLVTGLPAAALAAGWLWSHRRALWQAVPVTGVVTAWFVAGASSWSFCYLANSNYEYRTVLLLLPAALWLRQADDPRSGPVMRAQLLTCLMAFWLVPFKTWWAVASRTPDDPFAFLGFTTVFALEQVLMAALTAALLIGLAGWGWRRWHHDERRG